MVSPFVALGASGGRTHKVSLQSIFARDRRSQLYERLQRRGFTGFGELEAAERNGELLLLDDDSRDYCAAVIREHKKALRSSRFTADIVHNFIAYDEPLWQTVIDTPPFQRLRHLKQMGGAVWVYPNSNHTRFEHSLGVGYLAREWFKLLRKRCGIYGNEGEIEAISRGLEIAGLCHDLGHGPYSHSFESFVRGFPGYANWCHEDMSLTLFDYMVNDMESHGQMSLGDLIDEFGGALMPSDIKEMIRGRSRTLAAVTTPQNAGASHTAPSSAAELSPTFSDSFGPSNFSLPNIRTGECSEDLLRRAAFTIVANKVDGFDVDRFDYLLRDSQVAERLPKINPHRLMNLSSINSEGQIVFSVKCQADVYGFYRCRYHMYQNVYLHKNNQAIECMLQDVMRALEPMIRIEDCVSDPEQYLSLTDDSILGWFGGASRLKRNNILQLSPEYECAFQKAAQIVKRIERRDLYPFIGTLTCGDTSLLAHVDTSEKLLSRCSFPAGALKPDDIFVVRAEISHGAPNGGCPWNSVRFFKDDVDDSFPMDREAYRQYPSEWSTQKVMVYSRNSNPIVWDYIRSGVRNAERMIEGLRCTAHHETRSEQLNQLRYVGTPSRRRDLSSGMSSTPKLNETPFRTARAKLNTLP